MESKSESSQKPKIEEVITPEELSKKVAGVRTLEELANLLRDLGTIPFSDGTYRKTDSMVELLTYVIKKINEIFTWSAPEAVIPKIEILLQKQESGFTRNGEIRQKVFDLVNDLIEDRS